MKLFFDKSYLYIYIIVILCLMTIYTLFHIKNRVTLIRTELVSITKQLQYEIDAIHILKAEFAYLSSPKRLYALNKQYLKLKKTNLNQMIVNPLAQDRAIESSMQIAHNAPKILNTKWRYKKIAKKYLTMASHKTTHPTRSKRLIKESR